MSVPNPFLPETIMIERSLGHLMLQTVRRIAQSGTCPYDRGLPHNNKIIFTDQASILPPGARLW